MSSVSDVIVTESIAEVFSILTAKVALPPGSGSEDGLADFVTAIELATFVIVTIASSSSETGLPSSSVPEAVTMSLWELPALPLTAPWNEQL